MAARANELREARLAEKRLVIDINKGIWAAQVINTLV